MKSHDNKSHNESSNWGYPTLAIVTLLCAIGIIFLWSKRPQGAPQNGVTPIHQYETAPKEYKTPRQIFNEKKTKQLAAAPAEQVMAQPVAPAPQETAAAVSAPQTVSLRFRLQQREPAPPTVKKDGQQQ